MYNFFSFMEQLCNDDIFQLSNVRTNVRAYVNKAEKMMKMCSIEVGMKATFSKKDMGKSMVLFLIILK